MSPEKKQLPPWRKWKDVKPLALSNLNLKRCTLVATKWLIYFKRKLLNCMGRRNYSSGPLRVSNMIATPLHKKCDQLNLKDYGTIALLSIDKIFLRILMNRMKEKIENGLKEAQYGLWRRTTDAILTCWRTTDAIFIVRQLIEKAKEKRVPSNFHFTDFNPLSASVALI